MSRNPLIVAADLSDPDAAEDLARRLAGCIAYVKVGWELFMAAGPPVVGRMLPHAQVFLDLKLHDIPTVVRAAADNAARLGASLVTVHALGGIEMVRAAVQGASRGAEASGRNPPGVLGVTVLSSLAGEGLADAASLAFEAIEAGAVGVVASGEDVRRVREAIGPEPLVVVPGIRPSGQPANDHVRMQTPGEALERGADLIVIGRPVTQSPDPRAAAEAILREVGIG